MTTRDFEIVAYVMYELQPDAVFHDEHRQWAATIERLATAFQSAYPRFRAEWFCTACALTAQEAEPIVAACLRIATRSRRHDLRAAKRPRK